GGQSDVAVWLARVSDCRPGTFRFPWPFLESFCRALRRQDRGALGRIPFASQERPESFGFDPPTASTLLAPIFVQAASRGWAENRLGALAPRPETLPEPTLQQPTPVASLVACENLQCSLFSLSVRFRPTRAE